MLPKDNWKMCNELQHLPEQFNTHRSSQHVDGLDHGVNALFLVHVGRPEHREFWHSRVLHSVHEVGDVLVPTSLILTASPVQCSPTIMRSTVVVVLACLGSLVHCRSSQLGSATMSGWLAPFSATRLLGRHPCCSLIVPDVCVSPARACGRGWATHGLQTEVSTGVPWVLTGTHPCDGPPRQGGGTPERQLVPCWSVCSGASYTVSRSFCGKFCPYVLYCVFSQPKTKAKPQRKEPGDSSSRIIPINRKHWIDIEQVKHYLFAYEVSKTVVHLFRHSQQVHREEDGAVHFWRMKENLQSQFPQSLHWSDDKWKACLAEGRGAKWWFQYCTDVSGTIVYFRAP